MEDETISIDDPSVVSVLVKIHRVEATLESPVEFVTEHGDVCTIPAGTKMPLVWHEEFHG